MLYTSFIAKALAAFSILTAPVLGRTVNIPPELDARSAAKDVDIKWWTTLECRRSEHANGYNSGDCLNVEQRTAACMQRRKQNSCKMIRYEGKKCTGYSENGLNLPDCFSVKEAGGSLSRFNASWTSNLSYLTLTRVGAYHIPSCSFLPHPG